jgi:Protein of unknown function (DUF2469)
MDPEEDDIERFEEERELELYREYRDVVPMFAYVIETERRFYLANHVDVNVGDHLVGRRSSSAPKKPPRTSRSRSPDGALGSRAPGPSGARAHRS